MYEFGLDLFTVSAYVVLDLTALAQTVQNDVILRTKSEHEEHYAITKLLVHYSQFMYLIFFLADDLTRVTEGTLPNTEEGRCFVACMQKKFGFVS